MVFGKISFYGKAINALDNDVRVSKRLHIPSHRLRGFERGKVGPIENNDYIGGNYLSSLNISTTLPNLLEDLDNLDIGVFLDAANIWGVDYDSSIDDASKVRSSIGIGVDYLTVVGPLSFSLSQVISKSDNDVEETFRFNLGTTF